MGKTEAPSGAHISERQSFGENLFCLLPGPLLLYCSVIPVKVAPLSVNQLGYAAQYRHFPHYCREPFPADIDVEMALTVLADAQLVGVEAETLQEGEVPEGQVLAVLPHEGDFFIVDGQFPEALQLIPQLFGEALWIDLTVAVVEGVFDLCPRVGLEYVVLTGEGVQVVICKVFYYRFHKNFLFVSLNRGASTYSAKLGNFSLNAKCTRREGAPVASWDHISCF